MRKILKLKKAKYSTEQQAKYSLAFFYAFIKNLF